MSWEPGITSMASFCASGLGYRALSLDYPERPYPTAVPTATLPDRTLSHSITLHRALGTLLRTTTAQPHFKLQGFLFLVSKLRLRVLEKNYMLRQTGMGRMGQVGFSDRW